MEFEPVVERREVLRTLALLLGATAIPASALAAPARKAAGALDPARLKLLTRIADTIMPATDTPGAVAAGVPKLIDGMLRNWASAATRAEITGAIDAIGKLGGPGGFTALMPAARKAALLDYDKEAVRPGPPRKEKLSAFAAMTAGPPVMNPAYVKLKGLILALYYNSEAAMTQEIVFEPVPGSFVASLPVTPATRPFAGVGGLG